MAKISFIDKKLIEDTFELAGGYVFDLRNSEFADFIMDAIGIDIYKGNGYEIYESKANKLRSIFSNENDIVVGKLLISLANYAESYFVNNDKSNNINRIREIAKVLMSHDISINLPDNKAESIELLTEDINSALARNAPQCVLDRLHTFATKMLRSLCVEKGIVVVKPNGENLPLHSLAGMLARQYEKDSNIKSEFVVKTLKSSISLFEEYNTIRNKESLAHDNDVLGKMEAEYIVRIVAATIALIDNIERQLKRKISKEANIINQSINYIDDMPF